MICRIGAKRLSVILFKAMGIALTFFFLGGFTGDTIGRDKGTVQQRDSQQQQQSTAEEDGFPRT
jgi:NAD/NADP transhydrogenase beta subunit